MQLQQRIKQSIHEQFVVFLTSYDVGLKHWKIFL
jgi:hypothetical protein